VIGSLIALGCGGGSVVGGTGAAVGGSGGQSGSPGTSPAVISGGGRAAPAANGGSGGRSQTGASGRAGGTSAPVASGSLVNPAPGSGFFLGVNFWNVEWEGTSNYFASGVSWGSTDNPWNPQLLTDLAPYHVLRFMDWNLINQADNPQASWDTRTQKTAKQGEPVAFEWQIDLCNRTKKDYWVNVPSQANADYFGKLASLIHDQLDPSLRVYVEWSNEVWNGSFPQRKEAQTQGQKLGLAGDDKAAAYQVYQSVRAFEAFEAVFGKDSPRLVKVLAGQAAWTGPCEAQLAALKDGKINPNGTKPTAYAVAPYFKGSSADELQSSGIPEATQWMVDSAKCASSAGLPLIAYEGGQDSYALGEQGCAKLQKDAAMRGTYMKFLDAMQGAKLKGPLMHYTHSGNCWGLKQKTSDAASASPKYQGVLDWLTAHP
jgi:hypothetical protein